MFPPDGFELLVGHPLPTSSPAEPLSPDMTDLLIELPDAAVVINANELTPLSGPLDLLASQKPLMTLVARIKTRGRPGERHAACIVIVDQIVLFKQSGLGRFGIPA